MTFTVDKSEGEPLGLMVDSAVFDRIRTCDNHCSFCFIYQLPKGLRRSLYVKDDDFRLSFLYGNYTTLTRFTEFDLERIIDEKLSPLYVSIHSTDPELRASMLRNPRGASSLRWLGALLDAGVEVHGQVVVCPGVNDGAALERTLEDVLSQYPTLASLCLVPLGVSDFTTEANMRAHEPHEAFEVVRLGERYAELARILIGRRIIHSSDEFYLIAGLDAPSVDDIDTRELAENGVGLVATFVESFTSGREMSALGTGFFQSVDGAPAWGYRAPRSLSEVRHDDPYSLTVLTGEYAAPILSSLLADAGHDAIEVLAVQNRYFGGNIKVAGLLTGADVCRAVLERGRDRTYLLPDVCLSEDVFLDGTRLSQLDFDIRVVETSGHALRRVLEEFSLNVETTS